MSATLQAPRRGIEITAKQRNLYFRLWIDVLDEMGWKHLSIEEQNEKRRAITSEVTGQESIKYLTNPQFTRLIEHLKLLANPLSVKAAIPVANPDKSAEDDERRQLIYAMNRYGFTVMYLSKIAEPICQKHGSRSWEQLPIDALRKLRFTIAQRAHDRKKKVSQNPF